MEKSRSTKVHKHLEILRNLVSKNKTKKNSQEPDMVEQQMLNDMFHNPLKNTRKPQQEIPKQEILTKAQRKYRMRLRRAEGIHNLREYFITEMKKLEENFPTDLHQNLHTQGTAADQCKDHSGQQESTYPRRFKQHLDFFSPLHSPSITSTSKPEITDEIPSPIMDSSLHKHQEVRRNPYTNVKVKQLRCKPQYTSTPKKAVEYRNFLPCTVDLSINNTTEQYNRQCSAGQGHNNHKGHQQMTSTPIRHDVVHQRHYRNLAKLSTPVFSVSIVNSPKHSASSEKGKNSQFKKKLTKCKSVRSRLFTQSNSCSDNSPDLQQYGFL